MATDADMTMDVFGEAFMKLVRERLELVATGDGSGGIAISLVDKGDAHSPRKEITSCSARVHICAPVRLSG